MDQSVKEGYKSRRRAFKEQSIRAFKDRCGGAASSTTPPVSSTAPPASSAPSSVSSASPVSFASSATPSGKPLKSTSPVCPGSSSSSHSNAKHSMPKDLIDQLSGIVMPWILQQASQEASEEVDDWMRREAEARFSLHLLKADAEVKKEEAEKLREAARRSAEQLNTMQTRLSEETRKRTVAETERDSERNKRQRLEDDDIKCITCEVARPEVLFFPCTHLLMCKACVLNLSKRECPKCRLGIHTEMNVNLR